MPWSGRWKREISAPSACPTGISRNWKNFCVNGYSPFSGRGHTGELFADEVISSIAAAHDVTSAQVVLRWNLQRGVVVIPGSSNPEHIRENLDIFGFELTDAEMEQISGLDRGGEA